MRSWWDSLFYSLYIVVKCHLPYELLIKLYFIRSLIHREFSQAVTSIWRMLISRTKGKNQSHCSGVGYNVDLVCSKCINLSYTLCEAGCDVIKQGMTALFLAPQAVWNCHSHGGLCHHRDDRELEGLGSHVEAALCGEWHSAAGWLAGSGDLGNVLFTPGSCLALET